MSSHPGVGGGDVVILVIIHPVFRKDAGHVGRQEADVRSITMQVNSWFQHLPAQDFDS